MSDKVVVMNDGDVEQVDTPDGLYTQPANTFVAEFIGNPSMNFLDVGIESVDGSTIDLSIGGRSLTYEFDVPDQTSLDSEAILGFRPEAVELGGDDGDLDAEIVLIERIGDRLLVTLESAYGELRATVPAKARFEEEETVQVTIDKDRAHLFDAVMGELIAGGTDV